MASTKNSRCKKCNNDDESDIITCELCGRSEHLVCAGVPVGFLNANVTWYCQQCDQEKDRGIIPTSDRSSITSRRSQRLKLALEELEVQNRLRMMQIEAEKEFYKEKYQLLKQMEEEEELEGRSSLNSEKSKRYRPERRLAKNTQFDHAPKNFSTPSNQVILGNLASSMAPHKSPSNVHPFSSSLLDRTIIAPVDMEITTTENSSLPTMVSVEPVGACSSSAMIKSSTSVTFTSSNLVKSLYTAAQGLQGSDSGNFDNVLGGHLLHFMQKTNNTVPCHAQWDLNPTIGPGAVYSESSSAPLYAEARKAVCAVQSGSQMFPCMVNRNVVQPNIQFGYQQPTVSQYYSSVAQMMPSSTAQFPGVQLDPRSRVPVQYHPIAEPPVLGQVTMNQPSVTSNSTVLSTGQSPLVPAGCHGVCSSSAYASCSDTSQQQSRGPTTFQIAARQVMARDLPIFAGNPEDWPIFLSFFQNSTETCGYSDAENLARLQRCLRGPALEVVKSRLLLPASVPHVIEVLRKLYGKPEALIHSLLLKVRHVQPPSANNLNSIIAFGLAVQNLVDHISISGQTSHLTNPMLLQELVSKLPTQLKMQWGQYKRSIANIHLGIFKEFMEGLVDIASDLTLCPEVSSSSQLNKEEKAKREDKLFIHAQEQLSCVEMSEDSAESSDDLASPEICRDISSSSFEEEL